MAANGGTQESRPLIAGRYRIIKPLGEGGFGQVFCVEDIRAENRRCALKTLKTECLASQLEKRFVEEAKALSSLKKHDCLPQIYDFGTDAAYGHYYAFDLVEGETLLDRMQRTTTRDERLRWAVQFFDVLDYIHRHHIVHRDIKPENMMVREDGQLILIDFGIAKDLVESEVRTTTGKVLGTPPWMTPDQFAGDPYTTKTDLYQGALVMFWLISGGVDTLRRPEGRELAINDIIGQRMFGTPNLEPLKRQPWYGAVAGQLEPFFACLNREQSERPASAGVVKQALEEALAILEGRQALGLPTVDAAAVPTRRPSGRIAQPTTARKTSGPTVAAEVAPPPTSSKRASNSVRVPVKVAAELGSYWAGVGLAGAATLLVVVGLSAAWSLRVAPAPTKSTTPTASVAPPSSVPAAEISSGDAASPSGRPPAPRDHVAAARALRNALRRTTIGERWLGQFESRVRKQLKKAPATVTPVLESELSRAGVLTPLKEFLAVAPAYFRGPSGWDDERCALRSALCDVELIEYFCDEYGIPWPLVRSVARCAGPLDREFDTRSLSLAAGKSWLAAYSWYESKNYTDQPREFLDEWLLPTPTSTEECWVWLSVISWRTGLVAEITVNGRFRRLIRFRKPETPLPPIPLHLEGFKKVGSINRPCPITIFGDPKLTGRRGYMGRMIPRHLMSGPTKLHLRMIDLPNSPTTKADPNLWDRIVSIVRP